MTTLAEADERYEDILKQLQKKCADEIAEQIDLDILKKIDFGAWAEHMVWRLHPHLKGKIRWREWAEDVAMEDADYPNGKPIAWFDRDSEIWMSDSII